jgi:hypothetical protein
MKNLYHRDKNPNRIGGSISNDIKTTDINILLNRVKLNKKYDNKKKIIFTTLMLSLFSLISFIAII